MVFSPLLLLKKKNFLPFFLTQFFGAFNDNAYKLAMLTLISYHLSAVQAQSEHYQALAGALYILPFFLFSAVAGQLADKYDKATIARGVKSFEILLMAVGGYAFYHKSIILMMIVLAGMGVHSAFFGPIKYAILPDHLPREKLLTATALVEASTFLAIFLGTTLGSLVVYSSAEVSHAVFLINGTAILGLVASFFIPAAASKASNLKIDWRIWPSTREMLKGDFVNREILPVIFGISWFWLIGAVMLTKLPDYTHYVLKAQPSVFAFFLALFSLGIAAGSLTISYLLADKITLHLVPIAMGLLSLFALDLYLASPKVEMDIPLQSFTQFFANINHIRITFDFFFFSFCGGLIVVPLYTYLQVASEDRMRARTIATNNIFNALFMIIGSCLVMILLYFNVGISLVFLLLSILNTITAGVWIILYLIVRKR